MRTVAICKTCGAAFLQCRKTQVTCSPACRRKYVYKMDRELPKPVTMPPQPKIKKPKSVQVENETMEDCKHKGCIYRGRIAGTDCCDYCFITGYPRGCKISECDKVVISHKGRAQIVRKLRETNIF